MLAIERRMQIQELLDRQGTVLVGDLAKAFGVTGETLRKDILALEQKGLLRRTHGGAISLKANAPLKKLASRMDEYRLQKRELSENAAALIREGDVIAVDEGSTAIEFARMLSERFQSLTVITHCLDVFNQLCRLEGFSVILCGGHFLPDENSFYGQLTLDMLDRLHVQKFFLFPSAVSITAGVMDYHYALYQVQRKFMDISDRIYILADSSKFGKTATLKVCDVRPSYTFVTDSGLPEDEYQAFVQQKINLIRSDRP